MCMYLVFSLMLSNIICLRFILRNRNKMEITVITLGGTITSIRVPDSSGNLDDVVLGYKDLQGV